MHKGVEGVAFAAKIIWAGNRARGVLSHPPPVCKVRSSNGRNRDRIEL